MKIYCMIYLILLMMQTYQILEQLNIPLERNNEDEGRTNPYGMKLLNLCIDGVRFLLQILDCLMISILVALLVKILAL